MDNSDRRARFEIGAHVRVIAPVFQHEGRIGIVTKRYLFSEDDPYGLYTHRYVVSFPELGTEAVFFASELARIS